MKIKRQAIAINMHSFVDVITNSSTELFVCNTDKSIEQIEGILREILETYNKENGTTQSYEDSFETPYIYTQEMLDRTNASKYGGWGYENSNNVGKLMIASACDNTIPYDIWDDINEMFDGHNYHLG